MCTMGSGQRPRRHAVSHSRKSVTCWRYSPPGQAPRPESRPSAKAKQEGHCHARPIRAVRGRRNGHSCQCPRLPPCMARRTGPPGGAPPGPSQSNNKVASRRAACAIGMSPAGRAPRVRSFVSTPHCLSAASPGSASLRPALPLRRLSARPMPPGRRLRPRVTARAVWRGQAQAKASESKPAAPNGGSAGKSGRAASR